MIYNLLNYLKMKFPIEQFYINVSTENNNVLPDRLINLYEVPSTEQGHSQRVVKPIQFTVRDIDHVKTWELSNQLWPVLINCYNITLPAAVVEGVTYPAVLIGAVNPGNPPYNLGPDNESRNRHTFILTYYYRRV